MSDICHRSLIYATTVTVIAKICFLAVHNLCMICPEYERYEAHMGIICLENKNYDKLKSRLRSNFGQTVYLLILSIGSYKPVKPVE